MLERASTWLPLQVEASGTATGDVADRLAGRACGPRSALAATSAVTRSAALLVAPGGTAARALVRRFDLRVDVVAAPLEELARSAQRSTAYEASMRPWTQPVAATSKSRSNASALARELAPDDTQVAFWHAIAMAGAGRLDEARPDDAGSLCDGAVGWPRSATASRRLGERRALDTRPRRPAAPQPDEPARA